MPVAAKAIALLAAAIAAVSSFSLPTGAELKEWLDAGAYLLATVLTILVIMSSQRAKHWLWWTISLYIVLKVVFIAI